MTDAEGHAGRLRRWAGRARRSALVRSGAGLGGLTAAEMGLALLAAILLARELGVEGFGAYSLAVATVGLAALPVEFGLPSLVMREIARASAVDADDATKGVIVFAATAIALLSTGIIPLALGLAYLPASGLGETARSMLAIAVFLIPVNAFAKMLGATLAGRQKVVLGAIPVRLVRPGVFAAALGLAALAEPGWLTPARAITFQLGAAGAALAVAAGLFLAHYHAVLRRRGRTIHWLAWTGAMLRLGVSSGMMQAQPQILLLLTGTLASVEAVGLLRIAQRGVDVVIAGTVVAVTVAAPRVARLLAEGAHARVQRLVTGVARIAFGICMIGLVAFLLAGQWLLATLFGDEFVSAWIVLIVLTSAHGVNTMLGPGVMLMNMARREGVTLSGFALSLCLAIAVAVPLIPLLEALGAACGRAIGMVAMNLLLCYRARRDLRIDPTAMGWSIPSRRQVRADQ